VIDGPFQLLNISVEAIIYEFVLINKNVPMVSGFVSDCLERDLLVEVIDEIKPYFSFSLHLFQLFLRLLFGYSIYLFL